MDLLYKAYKLHKLNKKLTSSRKNKSGLVPVEKTVKKPTKQGYALFIQTFWVKPDQITQNDTIIQNHSDYVTKTYQLCIPNYDSEGNDLGDKICNISIQYDSNMISGDLLDNQTQVEEFFKQKLSDILKDYFTRGVRSLATSVNLNLKRIKNKPEKIKFKVAVSDINITNDFSNTTMTFQYTSQFKYDEIDDDTKKWLESRLLDHLPGSKKSLTSKNINGYWGCQIQCTYDYLSKEHKRHLVTETLNKMRTDIQQKIDSYKPMPLNTKAKTKHEQDTFGDILQDKNIQTYRTLGICANDPQANQYLQHILQEYLIKSIMSQAGISLSSDTWDELMDMPLQKLRDQLKTWDKSLKETLEHASLTEDNEIKCKLSSVTDEEFKTIVQQIEADQDKKYHGYMKYKIHGIYRISGLELEDEFNQIVKSNEYYKNRRAGEKNCQIDTFYHGTGAASTCLILGHSGQFEVGDPKIGRMLGNGIYLADKSSKSAQYIREDGFLKNQSRGSLLLCKASLGDCYRVSGEIDDEDDLKSFWEDVEENYDSTYDYYRTLNPEWCLYDPQAILPQFVVDLEVIYEE